MEAKTPIMPAQDVEQDRLITGDIFPNLLNDQVGKYEEFMGDADVLVPETILDRPRRRLKGLEKLREDIMAVAEEVQIKVTTIYNMVHENIFNEQTDEGYLEIEQQLYEKCFTVRVDTIQNYLDEEVLRLRTEYKKAQEDAKQLVEQMEWFLKQNHTMVQDFLKTTHKAIVTLSKGPKQGE